MRLVTVRVFYEVKQFLRKSVVHSYRLLYQKRERGGTAASWLAVPPSVKSLHPHPQPINFGLDGTRQLIHLHDPLQEEVHAGLGGGLLWRMLVVYRHDRPGQPILDDAELWAVDAVPEVTVGALVGQVVIDCVGAENRRPPAKVAVDTR